MTTPRHAAPKSTIGSRIAILAVCVFFVGGCENPLMPLKGDPLRQTNCPDDVANVVNGAWRSSMTPDSTKPGFFTITPPDSTKSEYVTIIIDGRVAASNVNVTRREPLNIPNSPPFDQIKNVHIASHTMSYKDIAQRYGTCPGVAVHLWETKDGSWQPNATR